MGRVDGLFTQSSDLPRIFKDHAKSLARKGGIVMKIAHETFTDPAAKGVISRAEILGAFSYALDITQGQPAGHCQRACWIGCQIGLEIGLAGVEFAELYYTVLLKDLGCSSNAARICELYRTDDHSFKHDFKLVTDARDISTFTQKHVGSNADPIDKPQILLDLLSYEGDMARELIETRCTRGAEIAKQLRFSDAVAEGIRSLDEHWDGKGQARGLKGDAIPLYSRIALLAQVAEVFHQNAGSKAALDEVLAHSGTWFDPELVGVFETIQASPGFWESVAAPDLEERLFSLEPAMATNLVDEDYLDDIAAAFGEVVDAKSPYTSGHSGRVAQYAAMMADRLDYPADKRRWLVRGALLHDIGKLGVSNTILDKPGKLDEAEWVVMRGHAVHTQEILSRIAAFEDMAPISAAHHERLDGRGYPQGLDERAISLETRIISVCDFYDALTADRPYRKAMSSRKALSIMAAEVGKAIDRDCFDALAAVVASDSAPSSTGN